MQRPFLVLRRFAVLLAAAVGLAACATLGISSEDTATGLFRVENDTPERSLEIALRTDRGNLISLGTVSSGDTESFLLPVEAEPGEYQLVAGAPEMLETPDVVVSESFIAAEGVTVNWYIQDNELEVS